MKIGNLQINGFVALAPMAGVADRAMRELCIKEGAAYCVGELASAKAIVLGDKKSATYLKASQAEQPFGCQLFGCNPEIMAEAARIAEEYHPAFIDINMGCPAPKVAVAGGGGAALMRDPKLAGKIVRAVAEAVKLPVTVKIRTGWDAQSVTAVEVARIAEANGAAAITVHGRTRSQMYAPPCDIKTIAEVKAAVSVPVIANGDIATPADAARMYEQTNCDFIMVGRAAMGNPFLFRQINTYLAEGRLLPEPPLSVRLLALINQIEKMREYKGDHIAFLEARKHTAWYMHGLNGAAELRRQSAAISSMEDVLQVCKQAQNLNPDE
ncbi:MAG: tRNA dihydrouridine synthase DusB [Clostridia bacterium]|nr:tRNA dihydrouridine synthase DusB [Clostridia bacterium]